MTPFLNLLRLARPINLLIVALTMVVVRYFIVGALMHKMGIGMHHALGLTSFMVITTVAVMLTAAGNIINDYFDQKVDRINKPNRVIVGKHIKRRVAIILHQTLNIAAVLLTALICFRIDYWWPMLFPITIATLLWWYSPVFKKKLLIGNVVVAICTASVPLWAGIFEWYTLKKKYGDLLVRSDVFFENLWAALIALSAFAFLLTISREAQKDMEDLAGDQDGGYSTMPISMGIPATKRWALFFLLLVMGVIIYGAYYIHQVKWIDDLTFVLVMVFTIVPGVMSSVATIRARSSKEFHLASSWTRWMMVGGIIAFCLLSWKLTM